MQWKIEENTLFITGTGAMPDFDYEDCDKWNKGAFSKAVIGEGITSIGECAFLRCRSLENVVLPEGVKFIGDNAFLSCKNLKSINIPDGVIYVGNGAFKGCWDLESITILDSVADIGDGVFLECYNLTIHTPRGSTAHRYAVTNNIKVKLIDEPKKERKIKDMRGNFNKKIKILVVIDLFIIFITFIFLAFINNSKAYGLTALTNVGNFVVLGILLIVEIFAFLLLIILYIIKTYKNKH